MEADIQKTAEWITLEKGYAACIKEFLSLTAGNR